MAHYLFSKSSAPSGYRVNKAVVHPLALIRLALLNDADQDFFPFLFAYLENKMSVVIV